MAKANSVTGTTWYIPEGHVVPNDVPEGVVLVGPGVAVAEPEVEEVKVEEVEPVKEVPSSQPVTTSSPSTAKTKNS